MKKPNFLVVGAAKCGTTSLYGYLKQHPDVFLPEIKECRYFSNVENKNTNPFTNTKHTEILSDKNDYYKLFEDKNHKSMGDVSPDYLYYYEESIKKIKKEVGDDVKIIIILRSPIERTYSNYLHILKEGYDKFSISEVIENEEKWIKNNIWYGFYITKPSLYFKAVEAYINNFKNVKVIIFEEFIKDVNPHLKELCTFLEIDNQYIFSEPAFKNKTGKPKNKFINNFLSKGSPFKYFIKFILIRLFGKSVINNKIKKLKESNLIKPELDKNIQEELLKLYIDDIEKLEILIKKNLSIWKSLK